MKSRCSDEIKEKRGMTWELTFTFEALAAVLAGAISQVDTAGVREREDDTLERAECPGEPRHNCGSLTTSLLDSARQKRLPSIYAKTENTEL